MTDYKPVLVGFCEDTALSLAERTFSSEVDEQLAEDIIQYARQLHDMYTAPQPTTQVEPVAWVTEVTVEGQEVNGKPRRIWWENKKGVGIPIYTAPQQPATDVSALLVKALERIASMGSMSHHSLESAKITARNALDVLAAHRKQGGK